MQKIRIDFDNPGLPQHISAVENDSQSRFFQATLYENGKAYTAPAGASYSIMYRGFGPQNQGWYDTINDGAGKRAACAVSGNVVTCEIARQALQVSGHVSIVLCVTTGKGYMLKSWPIECDCKNDRYDSTAEIQSFFYITQVTNADWTQAIQAWENLKDAIDPTLSVSGKAADAKATGLTAPCDARWVGHSPNITVSVNEHTLTPSMPVNRDLHYISRAGRASIFPFTNRDYTIKFNSLSGATAGYYGVYIAVISTTINIDIVPATIRATTAEYGSVFKWFKYDGKNSITTFWEIDTIATIDNHWANKQWYAYGTSITNVASEGRYPTYLANLSGLILNNKGISGGGIVTNTKIKDAIMNITDGKLNADIITIEVGANDTNATLGSIYSTSSSDFCGALNQCIRYLQQYVPNSQIVVWGSPMLIESSPNSGTYRPPETTFGDDNHTQYDQREAIKKVCAINSVKYIDIFESCGMGYYKQFYNRSLTQDGVHPSDIGGKNIAEYIWGQLKNVPLWYTSV